MDIKKEEIWYIIASAILIGYLVSFSELFSPTTEAWFSWIKVSLASLGIVALNIFAKKYAAYKKGCKIETKLWTFRRFGFPERMKFPFPMPIWFILPLLVTWFSAGKLWWLAILVFEAEPAFSRIRARWVELTEWDLALIAGAGVYANIVLAIILKAFGAQQFALLSAWFAFFSLIPIGNLDGAKIFFGGDNGRLFWMFSLTLTLLLIILLNVAGIFTTLIAGVIGAAIMTLLFYLFEKKL